MRSIKESWLVFCDSTSRKNKILKKNFRHVYIITRDEFNWYLIDPDWRFLNVKILPYRVNYSLPTKFIEHGKVIHIKHKPCSDRHLLVPWKLFTCIGVVKYALGISMFAFTPWQLFKRLKNLENTKLCAQTKTILYVNELGGE